MRKKSIGGLKNIPVYSRVVVAVGRARYLFIVGLVDEVVLAAHPAEVQIHLASFLYSIVNLKALKSRGLGLVVVRVVSS